MEQTVTAAPGRFDLVIWDLDGTLIDSKADLVNAVNATRGWMDLAPLAPATVASYVGNGAPVLIRRALGPEAAQSDVDRALEYFIRFYHEHCLDETRLYPGVAETLEGLTAHGSRLAVLTNKPVRISHVIVEGLGLASTFFRIYGGNSFDQKKPHPIGIQKLMEETGAPGNRTLMVGDSHVDIETARNAGSKSCGVLYGFQPETFALVPPDYAVREAVEILRLGEQ